MKQNKIKKYSLMTLFLLVGLFMINTDVNAEDECIMLQCEYKTKIGDITLECDNQSNTKSRLQCVIDYSNSTATKFGFDGIDGKIKVISHNVCPNFYIYDKFIAIGSNYTLISEDADVLGLGFALTHPNGQKGIIDYAEPEPNSCSPKKSCTQADKSELMSQLDTEYKQISNDYTSYSKDISYISPNLSNASSEEEVKKICDPIFDTANKYSTQLRTNYNELGFDDIVVEFSENKFCTLSPENIEEIVGKYRNDVASLEIKLVEQGSTARDNCIKNSNISKEEQEQILKDNQEELEDTKEEIAEQAQNDIENYKSKITSINLGGSVDLSCEGLLGDDLLNLISEIFGYVQIAAPILLIVLGSVDFGQAVLSDDKDALKKATSKFVKRAIICVAIFFVPLILKYLLSYLNDMVKDPLCGIK